MIRSTTTILALAALSGGCSREQHQTLEFEKTRVVKREFELGRSLPERYAVDEPAGAGSGLAWDIPDGWVQRAPSQYRIGSFTVPEDGDCSISRVGGGLVQNINRWRAQFGLAAIGMPEVAALPKKKVGPGQGYLVEFAGNYTGMSGDVVDDAKLCGLVVPVDEGLSLFLKMVGPATTVDANREKLFALAASLRVDGAPPPEPPPATAGFDPSRLEWAVPDGWSRRQSSSSVRIVTVGPDAQPDAQAWVIAFPGPAGGIISNINRWRGEIGATALSSEEVAGLPKLRVLETPSTFVEAAGDYKGQDGAKTESAMFGVICPLDTHTVFIKMVGPAVQMPELRSQFLAFVESLRLR